MKIPIQTRLQRALSRADIPLNVQREVFNAVFAKAKGTPERVADDWAELRARVVRARRMLLTNSTKWAESITPLYREYADMLSTITDRIDQARLSLTSEGTPISLQQFTILRAAVNAQRLHDGKPEGVVCNRHWQTWVSKKVRDAFTTKVEQHYDAQGGAKTGNRFVPFLTREFKAENAQRYARITTAIKNMRRTIANCGTAPPMADTPFAALHLAACRQAERMMWRAQTKAPDFSSLAPVDWRQLLEPEMRQRLREAEADPRAVTLDGLRDFYFAPISAGEDVDELMQYPAVQELADELAEGGDI